MVRMLPNPTYAGTYVYGQFAYDACARSPTTGQAMTRLRPREEWPVCRHAAFPAYIAWEQFVANQSLLRASWYRAESRGAPRKGRGGVAPGHCLLRPLRAQNGDPALGDPGKARPRLHLLSGLP
jgi:hypothetical protein